MKKILLLVLISSIFVILSSVTNKEASKDGFQVFKPWEYNPELSTENSNHWLKMEYTAVLVYYGAPVKYDIDRNIRLKEETLNDTVFLYNVVKKAQDTSWLKRHIFLSSDSTKYAY